MRKTKEKIFTLPINIQMVNYCYLHEQAIQNNFKTPMHPYSKQISKNRNKKDITKQSLKVGNLAMSEL
jgi:hypothetical protein